MNPDDLEQGTDPIISDEMRAWTDKYIFDNGLRGTLYEGVVLAYQEALGNWWGCVE